MPAIHFNLTCTSKSYAPFAFLPECHPHTQALGNRGAMGSVNCEEPKNQPLCQREDIRMFPTLKYYRNKRGTIYSKSRAEANLVQFVIEQSAEPVCDLMSASEQF